jgi:type IV pilus assembly protein PilY1
MNMKQILNHTALTKARLSILSASITTLICSSVGASDIDIYKAPTTGGSTTTLMMMLDVSGSMRVTHPTNSVAFAACDFDKSLTSYEYSKSSKTVSGVTYDRYTCYGYNYGHLVETKFDRITRLKDAMALLLVGGTDNNGTKIEKLDDKIILGLSTLGAVNGTSIRNAGAILVPARALNANVSVGGRTIKQRQLILEKVLAINPISGTPTANSYAETAAYLMGKSTKGLKNTGFDWSESSVDTRDTSTYIQPKSIKDQYSLSNAAKECHAQGIYVLTDGEPNDLGYLDSDTGTRDLVRAALDDSNFACDGTKEGWDCIFKLNDSLVDSTKNKSKVNFLTAVIGFGKGFTVIPKTAQTESAIDAYSSVSLNVRNTAKWGVRGNGGWYSGESTEDIVESFQKFLGAVNLTIPGISTGNATLPIDALNSNAIQPYGYFPQFVPKVATTESQRTWYGNLKKYHAVLGSLYGNRSGSYPSTITGSNPVMQNNEIKNVPDLWKNSAYVPTSNETAFQGGALSNLLQGYVADRSPKERLLLTDFSYQNGIVSQNLNLSWYDDSEKKTKFNAITTAYNLNSSAPYRAALMGLLGYESAVAGEDLTTKSITGKLPQIGAILHSKPVLLTQSGIPTVTGTSTSATIDTTNRDDYILFGSTQGVLHVLDAKDGKGNEVFAFIPKEMIELQNQGFLLDGGADTGGKNKLYYGIDGEWTAHTVYVSDSNGKLTVDGGSRTIQNDAGEDETINLKGKQWVYGGLRMGGRSYYSLDLTDMSSPKVKFHIDPNNKQVHYLDGSVTKSKTIDELKYMGQSWSKPTLAYVNWFGTRKLVMIVGGGYDAGSTTGLEADGDGIYTTKTVGGKLVKDKRDGYGGYEAADYTQTNKIGAGVYMFDADNGDLLWSVSGNNTATTTSGTKNLKLAGNGSTVNMNYSIVSEIKTVDRNNDGLIDHLYFGDLRGQAFRVDFSPSTSGFKSQVNRILDLSATRKRFYNAPTFTIHSEGTAVVSFASGNKSQPLHGYSSTVLGTDDFDGVFAIYDYDVYSSKYPTSAFDTRTLGANSATAISQLKLLDNRVDSNDSLTNSKRPKIDSSSGNGGWYYLFNKEEALSATGTTVTTNKNKQILKSLGSLVAMESDLYVPVFDSSKPGTTGSCSAGVAGETALQRFCLPYGICKTNIYIPLGAGIGEPIIGGGRDGDPNKRSIFVLNEDKKDGVTGSGSGQIKNYGGALKLIPNRWYEQYAQGGG